VADWVVISSLATAGGTLVLASATFASVRSANKAARTAERSLLAGLRPLLSNSRLEDAPIKVTFLDRHILHLAGSAAAIDITDQAIYLGISIRNIGSGVAVLDAWRFLADPAADLDRQPDLSVFHRLTRDIYVAPGDTGFWQGALRDAGAPEFQEVVDAVRGGDRMAVEVLYGDYEGGQRTVSRFGLFPREDGTYLASVARHRNLDRADPR
jgi:hypothetical protein